jgi:hypothetical protein
VGRFSSASQSPKTPRRSSADMTLELSRQEKAALVRMKQLRAGGMEASRIAEVLKHEGFTRTDGRLWDHLIIRRVLAQGWATRPLQRG